MLTRKLIGAMMFVLMLSAGGVQAGGDAAKGAELAADPSLRSVDAQAGDALGAVHTGVAEAAGHGYALAALAVEAVGAIVGTLAGGVDGDRDLVAAHAIAVVIGAHLNGGRTCAPSVSS